MTNNDDLQSTKDLVADHNQLQAAILDHDDFRVNGCRLINYVANYLEHIDQRNVFPRVRAKYLDSMIDHHPPQEPESWNQIISDLDNIIMPGMTHWQHPQFHAYFPTGCSYASICGDIVCGGLSCIGFSWASSPVCTELEVWITKWLAEMLGLPKDFYEGDDSGGVIQSSSSEGTLIALLAARNRSIKKYQDQHLTATKHEVASKLIGYYSDQAHSSVERAGLISMLELTKVQSNDLYEMTGDALEKCIEEDIKKGLIPFFCAATLGTTGLCSFDKLDEIGPVCAKYGVWLHVDAAYAGSAFICPENRYLYKGIEYANSFVFNPHKWLLVNFDCSVIWYRELQWIVNSFKVNPTYLKYKHQQQYNDFRHWQIPLGRRFRSLKVWFTLRRFGVKRLQAYIRNHINLAKYFENLILKDGRFEVLNEVRMGLICFRIKNDNELTKKLFENIELDGRIYLVSSEYHRPNYTFYIRFAICAPDITENDVNYSFDIIRQLTDKIV